MLELIILIVLGRNIGAVARKKGRRASGYVLLLVLLWFGGEFAMGLAAALISIIASNGGEPSLPLVYLFGLLGAAVGAFIAFQIAKSLAPKHDEWLDEGVESSDEAYPGTPPRRPEVSDQFYNPDDVRRRRQQSGEFRAGDE